MGGGKGSALLPAYLRLLVIGLPLDDALVERAVRATLDLAQGGTPIASGDR